jgi:hypothetical protein
MHRTEGEHRWEKENNRSHSRHAKGNEREC